MRLPCLVAVVAGLSLTLTGAARADNARAKELIEKATTAHGGEAELKKLESHSLKMKGAVHVMGMELAFTADASSQGTDRRRIDIEVEVMNQKIQVTNVFNKDKGWVKTTVGGKDDIKEMDKDQLTEAREQSHANSVVGLLPLKDKAYSISVVGDDKVGNSEVTVVRISRKDYRDVSLFIDKKSHLILKHETRVKDEQSGQEVTEEGFYLNYNDKGLRQPKKISVKRDGKVFVEADVLELNPDVKFAENHFGKP